MGCDYYIVKQLKIEHSKGYSYIELNRERGYIFEYNNPDYDSDDPDSGDKYYDHTDYLKVDYIPKVFYENDMWKSEELKYKYSDRINKILTLTNYEGKWCKNESCVGYSFYGDYLIEDSDVDYSSDEEKILKLIKVTKEEVRYWR